LQRHYADAGWLPCPRKARSDKVVNGKSLEERIGELDQRIDDLEKPQYKRFAPWISLLALAISVFSLLFFDIPERLRPPAVKLVMPSEARLAQIPTGTENTTYSVRVYLQPAFVITGRSRQAAVLKPVNLFVKPEGEPQCKKFWMNGIGSVTNIREERGLVFTYESGASPLLVTQDAPQNHVLAFTLRKDREHPNVEEPYFVGEHKYFMTLVAKTTSNSKPLRRTISVSADQAALKERAQQYLGQSNSRKFVTIGARSDETPNNCPNLEE
jgi:hypothetical protein